jgi:hypothetical protein
MKKLLMMMAACFVCAAASAQMTPEAIMGMTPDLPTSASLLRFFKESEEPYASGQMSEPDLINDFVEAYREAERQVKDMQSKTIAVSERNAAMQGLVGGTGKTAQQVSQMSEAEVKAMAMSTMNGNIARMGLSQADMARLMQGGELTKEEEQAMASKMLAAQMTPENQAKHATNKNKTALVTQFQRLNAQAKEKTDAILAMKGKAQQEGLKLYEEKYSKRVADAVAGMRQAIRDGALDEIPSDPAKSAAAYKRFVAFDSARFAAIYEFYTEYIPAYRNAVAASMESCRADLLPILLEKKQVQEKIYALTREADWALYESIPFEAAYLYMERSYDIVDYTLELPGSEL